ncbi:hypothetical protein GURKE_01560 [Brevundimonas phage vB_BpoS-Gurke]|uniref:Uncharacterized protein n=1 Tax=Brevundimonas phage vB_BpoS-Gurke TaxID=2948599 RepID=A0A9E7N461_9CAUD|nr:hypothetical protein GURKE_01560 [Brevundimonas phage vB_BpoS-Gurke]
MQPGSWEDVGPLYNAFEARRSAVTAKLDACDKIIQTPRYAFYFEDGIIQKQITDLRAALVEDCDGLDALAMFEDDAVRITDLVDIGKDRVEDWISDFDY